MKRLDDGVGQPSLCVSEFGVLIGDQRDRARTFRQIRTRHTARWHVSLCGAEKRPVALRIITQNAGRAGRGSEVKPLRRGLPVRVSTQATFGN